MVSNLERWLEDMREVNNHKGKGAQAQLVLVGVSIARSLAVIADQLGEARE